MEKRLCPPSVCCGETWKHVGREVLHAHEERLLWEVHVKEGLLSTRPRAELWMAGEFRGDQQRNVK